MIWEKKIHVGLRKGRNDNIADVTVKESDWNENNFEEEKVVINISKDDTKADMLHRIADKLEK